MIISEPLPSPNLFADFEKDQLFTKASYVQQRRSLAYTN